MPIRITGLNSGLDTEAIISALVSSYSYKTNKYKKAQTKLSWKQDAWKTLNTKVYSFYTSLDSLRFSKNYNLKSTKVSDSTKATVTASSSAPNGTQKLNILKVAQAGYLTGGKLDDSTTTGTTLAELGYTGGNGTITLTKGDGTKKNIEVSQGTTVNNFINSLKEAGVNASYDDINKRIFVSSKDTGKDNDFTLTGGNVDGANALSKLGLNVQSKETQATYTSYTKYYDADGNKLSQNVTDAINAYTQAKESYNKANAQNSNLSSAYGYASAYTAMQDALKESGLSTDDQNKLVKLLQMSTKLKRQMRMEIPFIHMKILMAARSIFKRSTLIPEVMVFPIQPKMVKSLPMQMVMNIQQPARRMRMAMLYMQIRKMVQQPKLPLRQRPITMKLLPASREPDFIRLQIMMVMSIHRTIQVFMQIKKEINII